MKGRQAPGAQQVLIHRRMAPRTGRSCVLSAWERAFVSIFIAVRRTVLSKRSLLGGYCRNPVAFLLLPRISTPTISMGLPIRTRTSISMRRTLPTGLCCGLLRFSLMVGMFAKRARVSRIETSSRCLMLETSWVCLASAEQRKGSSDYAQKMKGIILHLSLTFSAPNFSPYHLFVPAAVVPRFTATNIRPRKTV